MEEGFIVEIMRLFFFFLECCTDTGENQFNQYAVRDGAAGYRGHQLCFP